MTILHHYISDHDLANRLASSHEALHCKDMWRLADNSGREQKHSEVREGEDFTHLQQYNGYAFDLFDI